MRDLRDSAHGGPRDKVSQYGISAFVCTVTSRRVGCGCTTRSFTTLGVTPQTRGSVDYSSTRGIQVDVGLPDATSENQAESPLYGELYPNTIPAYPVPNSAI